MEFEVYQDNAGEFRWRLIAGNGQIMADSGEGYSSRGNAIDAINKIRLAAPHAKIRIGDD